jgi:hypothetical protein
MRLCLGLTSPRRSGLYHVGGDRDLGFIETPPAKIDGTDFQGALAAIHCRLKQFTSYPDLAAAPVLVQLVPEAVLNGVPVTMEVLGYRLG